MPVKKIKSTTKPKKKIVKKVAVTAEVEDHVKDSEESKVVEVKPVTFTKPEVNYQQIKKQHTYVWLGVITLSLIIFGLWIASTVNFLLINKDKNSSFIESLKKDWQQINAEKDAQLNEAFPEQKDKNLNDILKNSLTEILKNITTSTTSTVVTSTITSTSTEISTNTIITL